MEDLNDIAKPLRELTQKIQDNEKIQQITQRQTQSDYLLYSVIALLLIGSIIFITIKINITLRERERRNSEKAKPEEEISLQPTTVIKDTPTILEIDEENRLIYPKLKMDF
jgi:large-conductance mechanosensitive channel